MNRTLKNLLRGMGSVLSIAPVDEVQRFKPKRYKPAVSDKEAMRADWLAVGQDLRRAIDKEYHGQQAAKQAESY